MYRIRSWYSVQKFRGSLSIHFKLGGAGAGPDHTLLFTHMRDKLLLYHSDPCMDMEREMECGMAVVGVGGARTTHIS